MKIEFEDHEKTILWVVGGAAALLGVYWALKASGFWDTWFGTKQVPAPASQPIQPIIPTQPQPNMAPVNGGGYPSPYSVN